MKICGKCKTKKELIFFGIRSSRPDGLHNWCKYCEKKRHQKMRLENPQKKKNADHMSYLKNKKEKNIRTNKYKQKKYKNDVIFKLTTLLRSRLKSAIKNNKKIGSAIDNLGCTIDELKLHLESMFQVNMTWDNHNFYGWHIDHIRPLSKFDLTDDKQLKQACHYTNLQPLWAIDNLIKGNKEI